MKVFNRNKVIEKFGSLTSFVKTTPFTLNQINSVIHNKHRKYFHGEESSVFQAYKYLDEQGYMIEVEESK